MSAFHLLSLGSSSRNNTMFWVNEEIVIYGGISEICIARNKNGKLIPESILPLLEKSTIRSLRYVQPLNNSNNQTDLEEIEIICASSDGAVAVYELKRTNDGKNWSFELIYKDVVEPCKMVDAFGFRTKNKQLIIGIGTFENIELRSFDEDCKTFCSRLMAPLSSYRMINCFNILPILNDDSIAFLCVFGRTDKKLGVHLMKSIDSVEFDKDSKVFEPLLLETRESVFDLDVRLGKTCGSKEELAFEILAGLTDRVQIWKIYSGMFNSTLFLFGILASDDFKENKPQGFSLETEVPLQFDGFPMLFAKLDSNITITSSDERLSSVQWDNQRDNFVISTRENSIRIYSLLDSSEPGVWTQKHEACSYGEPALELCGIFDAKLSPSSRWLLAHNTIGGFYFFECDSAFNSFTPTSVYIGGHGGKVRDVTWHNHGEVLLTVGSDKTTRYFKEYSDGLWGQRSRPQVHGHEIRCIASLDDNGFVSGAAEHMFRVFDNRVPVLTVDEAIERIQPLNLTPKAPNVTKEADDQSESEELNTKEKVDDDTQPSNEELLQSGAKVHTETRKLYAHGNECYVVASTPSRRLVFTAAKGSRPDEAQLIVWAATDGWKILERTPVHALTITAMAVSSDNQFLLTVSRDRNENNPEKPLKFFAAMDSAHKRVIWSCAWIDGTHIFATGSRDGYVALFELVSEDTDLIELQRLKIGDCVSSLEFGYSRSNDALVMVIGTETGDIHVANVVNKFMVVNEDTKLSRKEGFACSGLIYSIRYNPVKKLFAVCTEKGVVKCFSV
ncbi:hypothetical protein M3Y96_00718100 [Aphelenchoides besseyi]|nr:hypothetical protein M3Y96_00718100 [Aphelenchoides besseyi]